jgi:hypothetical protein
LLVFQSRHRKDPVCKATGDHKCCPCGREELELEGIDMSMTASVDAWVGGNEGLFKNRRNCGTGNLKQMYNYLQSCVILPRLFSGTHQQLFIAKMLLIGREILEEKSPKERSEFVVKIWEEIKDLHYLPHRLENNGTKKMYVYERKANVRRGIVH